MMISILITAIGSFSADIAIKNILKQGWRAIGCDIYPKEWIVDSGNVTKFYQSPLAVEEEKYLSFISSIIKKENIQYILPSTDVEVDVLNKHRQYILKQGAEICISGEDTIKLCRDKWKLQKFLNGKTEIDIIDTKKLLEINYQKLEYPVVCKPANGRSSQGLQYIYSEQQMRSFVDEKKDQKYIVQPKINGNIVTVDVVRHEKAGQVVALPRKELLRTGNGAGTTVLTFSDLFLEKSCERIADLLNINGCVNFEFILTETGKYYFLECNPRFSGGIEFSCMSGYDCVKNHFNCFMEDCIEGCSMYKSQYISRKYEEYITGVN